MACSLADAASQGCYRTVDYILLKLASRCNIACTYCYWFRDETVLTKPHVLTSETEALLLARLDEHLTRFPLPRFSIIFHGGEPMLFGKPRFDALCSSLRALTSRHSTVLKLDITTNGLLLDEEWTGLFLSHRVGVTLSIDGPPQVHDKFRIGFDGKGTLQRTLRALDTLRGLGVEPGVLAVCDPRSSPDETVTYLVDSLGVKGFDILIPDANHNQAPVSISFFYKRLFDLWYDTYQHRGVRIRLLECIMRGLLGMESHSESIGYGLVDRLTVLTDGSMESLDVLRIAGNGSTRSALNLCRNGLQDIEQDLLWREVYHSSLHLADECRSCAYAQACGGGHIATRWSADRGFNNPSVYCSDIKEILAHVWQRMTSDFYVEGQAPRPNSHVGVL